MKFSSVFSQTLHETTDVYSQLENERVFSIITNNYP